MDALVFAAFLSTASAPAAEFRPFAEPEPIAAPLSYSEARQKALTENKPLVAWIGTGDVICPACVAELKTETVHYFNQFFPEVSGSAIVVAVPEGGELLRIADVTAWRTGDADFGHVGSVRRVLRNWRAKRQVTKGGWAMDTIQTTTYAAPMSVAVVQPVPAPVVVPQAPPVPQAPVQLPAAPMFTPFPMTAPRMAPRPMQLPAARPMFGGRVLMRRSGSGGC